MVQHSVLKVSASYPSNEACAALLRELPAITAFRRAMSGITSEDARALVAPLSVMSRAQDGALRLGDVAERLHLDMSVASRHVSELEERGLVERRPDPHDGRCRTLHVTPAGERWLADVRGRFAERMGGQLVGWNDTDVLVLADLLRRFGASMEFNRAT